MLLSYCVVNTNGREFLLACLEAIERTTPPDLEHEILVLDNASDDGSADAVRALDREIRLIALDRREGKAANDSRLIEEARGEYCLLLNEDSELQAGAVPALLGALRSDRQAAAAGAQLLAPMVAPVPCAWRLPSAETALAGALFLHRQFTVESGGDGTRPVGWVQSSAMLVRREAALAGRRLRPRLLRLLRRDRLLQAPRATQAGGSSTCPSARAIHHDQMAQDAAGAERRIVEYHRGRDRYLRKHLGRAAAVLLRPLLALPYLLRALAALVLPGHSARRYWLHARQALLPRPRRGHPRGGGGVQPPHRVVAMRILVVTQMWPSPENPDLGSFLVPLTREIEALGHEVEVASISRRGGSPTKYADAWSAEARARREALRARRRLRPLPLPRRGGRGARAAAGRGAPLVVMAHGQDVANLGRIRGVTAATRWVVGRSSAVIANSRWLAGRLTERIPAAEPKIEVADCGVDLEAFSPRPADEARRELGWEGEGPAFLCVGSLIERKNVVRLAEAFASLGRGRLAFVGDGPLRAELEGRPGVHLVGRVPQSEVPRWVAACDVLCQPSLIEPFGQATLEAMAMERTVVATSNGRAPRVRHPGGGRPGRPA